MFFLSFIPFLFVLPIGWAVCEGVICLPRGVTPRLIAGETRPGVPEVEDPQEEAGREASVTFERQLLINWRHCLASSGEDSATLLRNVFTTAPIREICKKESLAPVGCKRFVLVDRELGKYLKSFFAETRLLDFQN